ncbi:MAG: Succinyl-CoA ligase [ADP-forming] subunit beta [Chlamydiae bacterium]|nr:Succinyl-CoA ligase [ADP-forming] subunit beta [Chlamydiota bacterium]
MNTHEFQAKEILKKYGIPIPDFGVAGNEAEVAQVIEKLGLEEAVVKIQVHAGGRGKAGGVKFAKSKDEIKSIAKALIGMKMVNNQTGPQGVIANQVMISRPADIEKEYYIGAVIDRDNARPILIASPEGGVEIEEVAEKTPEKILTLPIELNGTLRPYHALRLVNFMGWEGEQAKMGKKIAMGLSKAFIDTDASLLEINPLVKTPSGEILALDAKLSIDENALFRHPDFESLYDPSQQSASEVAAKQFDLAYIALDGTIGCMVNGAGLAMATMDVIHIFGGEPANFLDVGGGASKEKVAEGFRIILSDPNVKAILVNIFGGIMNCAVLAEGIIQAAHEHAISVPLIVRMEGTNSEQGKKMLRESGLSIIPVDSFSEAAKLAVSSR